MTRRASMVMTLLALTACGERGASRSEPAAPERVDVSPCPGARIVALLDPAADSDVGCDLGGVLPQRWRGVRLFEAGSPGVAALAQSAPGELRRYCSYEWTGRGAAELDELLAVLDASPHVLTDTIGLDCGTARGRGDLDPDVAAALHDRFRRDIGWVSGASLGPSAGARTPIEVAIVDTVSQAAADEPELEPADPHGVAMAALVADITCPGRGVECRAWTHHTLALPRVDTSHPPDWVRGGRRGTPADVALAIYEAIERWDRRRQLAPHLVINLSVGWDRVGAGLGPDRALQAALEYAACRGVLVFAAAGNGGDPRCDTSGGPLTPASFEAAPAPDAASCRALGFVSEDDEHAARGGPLVFALGAVDGHDRPLANTRAGAQAQLVAPASQGLARTKTGEYSLALSGSSVSTAVASGIAALVWSYRPQLRADEVVEILRHSGRAVDLLADFGLPDASTEVRRISACAALDYACREQPSESCPQLDCVALAEADDEHGDDVRAAVRRRRAAHPERVRVHRGSTRSVSDAKCPESPDLAAALGR